MQVQNIYWCSTASLASSVLPHCELAQRYS
jgi:hypothetical protein